MTKRRYGNDQLYGNFGNEQDDRSLSWTWVYEGLICRIWDKQWPGMVPLRRLYSPVENVHPFTANEEDADWWIKERQSTVEFTVGYVYRRDAQCPDGAVPLYQVIENERGLGRLLTISESERCSCVQLGASDEGIQCYVAPP